MVAAEFLESGEFSSWREDRDAGRITLASLERLALPHALSSAHRENRAAE